MLNPFKAEVGTRKWYSVTAKQDGKPAEVFIYDQIGVGFFGGGVAAEDLIKEIKALKLKAGDELLVRVNSPGGQMFEGFAIYNYLRSEKAKVVVRVDGVAASAASMVAMAGDRVEMPQNAMMFIHNPLNITVGDARAHREAAAELDKFAESFRTAYTRKAGDKLPLAKLIQMLDAETWLNADESVALGLADVVDEPVRASALAKFDLEAFGIPVPKALTDALRVAMKAERERLTALKI
jgi:ATP-dependent protease ClpP protease subunit